METFKSKFTKFMVNNFDSIVLSEGDMACSRSLYDIPVLVWPACQIGGLSKVLEKTKQLTFSSRQTTLCYIVWQEYPVLAVKDV